MFNKKSDGGEGRQGRAIASAIRGAETAISLIGPGMRIVGDVVTDGSVRVEGSIQGTLRAARQVQVGKSGEVVGDVLAEEAIIGGRIRGTLAAPGRILLQATCDVEGEVHATSGHFILEEGGRFSGQIRMNAAGEEPRALPAAGETGENAA